MSALRLLYGTTVFLGAFLLFMVEPMAAKQLLPALGGSSAVWLTCLVFFQVTLLLGYLYAHWLTRGASSGLRQGVYLAFPGVRGHFISRATTRAGIAEPTRRPPRHRDLPRAFRHHRTSFSAARRNQPALANMVCSHPRRRRTIPAVCALKHRLSARASGISNAG